jgi:glycosyltransferase involved in cell wall biosynthesis
MGSLDQVAVVVPCLNEGVAIRSLVTEIRELLPHVLVIDDGSVDCTAAEAVGAGANVLVHSSSRGKGAALQSGFAAALDQGFEWVLAMDGDGQHAPSDIPRFVARIESNPAAMVIGDRMQGPGAMPFVRRVVNRWMSQRLGGYCGRRLPDSQCGFRLIHLEAWKRFRFSAQHFEIESELIVRFLKAGLRVDFVPVQCRYASENSKIRPLRDTLRWFRWWKAIRRELAMVPNTTTATRRDPHFAHTAQDAPA